MFMMLFVIRLVTVKLSQENKDWMLEIAQSGACSISDLHAPDCLYETSCTSVKHRTAMVLRYTGILIKQNGISNRQNDTAVYRYIGISLHP